MAVNPKKILVVEDDPASQSLMRKALQTHDLTVVGSGEAALELDGYAPELAILDIQLPGMNGYETCRQLRQLDHMQRTPIIFLSSLADLEDRLEAYGAGGNDYISKPFDLKELWAKIEQHGRTVERQQEAEKNLSQSHGLLMQVQTAASKIQSICRFIQASLFCHDTESLFRQFFKTAREIELDCILQMRTSAGSETRSINGQVSALEEEILEMSHTMDRIHPFGKDRAVYRWGKATLMVRKVGDMIDTIALLMDALEAGLKKIAAESQLIEQVEQVQERNILARGRVTDQFERMVDELQNTILSLGLVAALDLEEEERLAEMVEGFRTSIDQELMTLAENNQLIMSLINELQTPPPELLSLMDDVEEEDTADMFFF